MRLLTGQRIDSGGESVDLALQDFNVGSLEGKLAGDELVALAFVRWALDLHKHILLAKLRLHLILLLNKAGEELVTMSKGLLHRKWKSCRHVGLECV